jgi:hypothetical protein
MEFLSFVSGVGFKVSGFGLYLCVEIVTTELRGPIVCLCLNVAVVGERGRGEEGW